MNQVELRTKWIPKFKERNRGKSFQYLAFCQAKRKSGKSYYKVFVYCPTCEEGHWRECYDVSKGKACLYCQGKYISRKECMTRCISSQPEKKYDYTKVIFKGTTTKIEIICPIHNSFWQLPVDHWRGIGCEKCGSGVYDWKTYKEKANKKHENTYTYPDQEWKETRQTIQIECPKHGIFPKVASIHLNGQGCPECTYESRRLPWEEVERRSKKVHGNFYTYKPETYTHTATYMDIICPVHGDFSQRAEDHFTGHGCTLCGYELASKSSTTTFSEFLQRARGLHGSKYNYIESSYTNMGSDMKIICDVHGEFTQEPSAHVSESRGGQGCYKCGLVEQGQQRRIPFKEFLKRANEEHEYKYTYIKSSYTKMSEEVEIVCKEHGKFSQGGSAHVGGQGCSICRESRGERAIRKYLTNKNVEHSSQKKFAKCKNIFELPFDFYIPTCDLLIEYQGEFHYGQVKNIQSEEKHQQRKYLDKIKKEYAEKHHNFLEIPYWEFNNIEKILEDKINSLK